MTADRSDPSPVYCLRSPVSPSTVSGRRSVLLIPIRDSASGQIIRRHLDAYPITDQDTNAILSHLPGDRRQYDMLSIVQLYFEKCVGLFVDYCALRRNQVVSCQ